MNETASLVDAPPVRRWLPVWILGALAVVFALALFAAVMLWRSNTVDPRVVREVGPLAPGESITLVLPGDGVCGPYFERLYRESFGRWRQTHHSQDGSTWTVAEVGIFDTGARKEFSQLPCPVSDTATLLIPEDVTWSPVLACSGVDGSCVKVEVAL